MRLLAILISVGLVGYLFWLLFQRLYLPPTNPAQMDTSPPAVNQRLDKLQLDSKSYQDTLDQFQP